MTIPAGSEEGQRLLDEIYAREHFDDYYEPVYQNGEVVMWRPKRAGVRQARLEDEHWCNSDGYVSRHLGGAWHVSQNCEGIHDISHCPFCGEKL